MKVEARWTATLARDGEAVDLTAGIALLREVARSGTLKGASEALGLSYRTVWGRLAAFERAFGRPLVAKTKGHGSGLTPAGAALLRAAEAAAGDLDRALQDVSARLTAEVAALTPGAIQAPPLRLAASHDPGLMRLVAGEPRLALTVTGSREAVERLLAGAADMAGFHGGTDHLPTGPPFDGLAAEPDMVIRPAFRREQGLLVAPGNPAGLTGIADLARPGLRFAARQKGSGTRAWLERLLEEAGIGAHAVGGFAAEEFTHRAVAALVAAGAADAGMGARDEARAFGLDFLPLGRETYFLAAREAHADALARLAALAGTLASPEEPPATG